MLFCGYAVQPPQFMWSVSGPGPSGWAPGPGSLIPFGVGLNGVEEQLVVTISQEGTEGRCVILGEEVQQ